MTIDVEEVRRRLFTLLGDQNMVAEYIRAYGPTINIKHIKAVKEHKSTTMQIAAESGNGDDPVFEVSLQCPVCNQNDITGYELRSKSQQVTYNRFMVPAYAGTSGYRTVNYSLIYTTVCPRCLFASPDKKDFVRPAKKGEPESKSQLPANIIMALQEKIGERKALLKTVTDYAAFFKRPRTAEAALAAIRLSMMRAGIEAWFEQPYSYYKLGSYALRMAAIYRECEKDNTDLLREGLESLEEAFRTSNCPSEDIEMQLLYTITALHIKLGDHRKANSYVAVFNNLRTQRATEMRENPALVTTVIDRWLEKTKFVWEDREQSYLFENE